MTNKRVTIVLILLSFMYLSLIGYLTYVEVFQREMLTSHSSNQRNYDYEDVARRGTIKDINGTVLAESVGAVRNYPYKGMYSHIIGYNSVQYQRSNLEKTFNDQLLAVSKISKILGSSTKEYGHNLVLTIDHSMQELAYKELGDRSGCVLAINPKTGAIIAMVSKPDFDPNEESLAENWNTLVEDDNHPFLARATSGLYAPGSTFKMLTALAAVENGYEDMVFEDNGSVTINGKIFENQKGKEYGEIGIKDGFAYSSNVVFGTLGFKLGGSKLFNVARRFGFNDVFDFDLEYMVSKFPQNINDDAQEAALAIGQGNMLATPLQMAMVTCGIANNGVVMKPYIVDRVVSKENRVVKKYKPTVLYEASDSLYTTKVVEMMVETVKNGTAKNLEKIKGVTIAGKTGTSENEKTDSDNNAQHTWFVSFAPAYDPEIVVVVMMEYSGGSGAGNCAPIARNIIKKYLKK